LRPISTFNSEAMKNVKLGLFVVAGLVFLVLSLYLIGKKQDMFERTFEISTEFSNVSGLIKGNNVRFAGINVGTVKKVQIESDSSVLVIMAIQNKAQSFIKKSTLASIGTDGLMGNTIVNLSIVDGDEGSIENHDRIKSKKSVDMNKLMTSLEASNQNLELITSRIVDITRKIDESPMLWTVLSDKQSAESLKATVVNLKAASSNAIAITKNVNSLIHDAKTGDGLASYLLNDTTFAAGLNKTLINAQSVSMKADQLMDSVAMVISEVNIKEGNLGRFMADTMINYNLGLTVENVRLGTQKFDENMEALKHNFFFRRYFKKMEKQKLKVAQQAKLE
jgi:phospholipid/cholesterol/gamma-HCH transport system substrate-binding protein